MRQGLGEIPPADPSDAYERIVEKLVRRRIARRAARVALVVVVLGGSAAGFVELATVFRRGPRPLATIGGGRIAFINFDPSRAIDQVSAGWGIYTMNPDGSDVRFVPADVDEALYPSFSPDGSQIAFAGYRADPPERGLFVTDTEGTTRMILSIDDRHHQIDEVAWSPDGTRIGFVFTEFTPTEPSPEASEPGVDQSNTIWTIAPDGSRLTQVTTVGRERDLSWSPDGSRIVFSRYERVSENQIRSDLYVVRADGSDEKQLTTSGDASTPAWSPDGRSIVYAGRPASGDSIDLLAIRVDGTDVRRLTNDPGNEYDPVWSPDGTAIAYAERALDPGWNASACFVTVMLPDGTGRQRIAGSQDTEGCPGQEGISWAPGNAASGEPATTVSDAVTATLSPASGMDVGLASGLCHVGVLTPVDFLGDGVDGTAWTGAPVNEAGRCPTKSTDTYVVAADVTGDGLADDAWTALTNCFMCEPYASTDLDGDGDDELVVLQSGGTTPRFELFDVRTVYGEPRLVPITVGPEDAAQNGFPSGAVIHVVTGGDEGFSGFVGCKSYPRSPEVFVGWADGPVDGPDSDVRQAHFVRFIVQDGIARILDSEAFTVEADAPLPYPFGTDNVACGVDWNIL